MSSLNQEKTIYTLPSGSSLGLNPDRIVANIGDFKTDLFVAGVDVESAIMLAATHIASTSAHGAVGDIVGADNVQRLTNKTLVVPNLLSPNIRTRPQDTPITFNTLNLTGVQRVYSFPNSDSFVLLASGNGQTVTQNLNFLTNPSINAIVTNGGLLTLPTTNGTVALVSDIPSTANLLTTDTPQTISTAKTFTTAPAIGSITNGGTLTLPAATDTLVGRATVDTFSGKTINSASNTIQVGGADINTLINQDLRTTAGPTFGQVTTGLILQTFAAAPLRTTESVTLGGANIYQKMVFTQTTAVSGTYELARLSFAGNQTMLAKCDLAVYAAGIQLGGGAYRAGYAYYSTAGVVTSIGTLYSDVSQSGVNVSLGSGIVGTQISVSATCTLLSHVLTLVGSVEITYT